MIGHSGFLVFLTASRYSRVGSSSGSGVSCLGRIFPGTLTRLTRTRVHVDERPRMRSTSTSSTARCGTIAACFFFQLRQGRAVFSGYISEQRDGFFIFKVFEQGIPIRTMIVGCLGYAGELTIDVEDLKEDIARGLAAAQQA